MFDPTGITFKDSPPLRYIGKKHHGLVVQNKRITRPTKVFNYECMHVEGVNDVSITNIDAQDFAKQALRGRNSRRGLVKNLRGNARLNNTANFCMAISLGNKAGDEVHDWHLEDIDLSQIAAWRGDTGWLNGDGFACEPFCTGITGERWSIHGTSENPIPDACIDIKSDLVLSGADLSWADHQIFKVWYGAVLTLIDADLDHSNVGITLIGAHGEHMNSARLGVPGRVRHYNVRFGPGIKYPFHLKKHDAPGSVKPTAAESIEELSENPYPDGIPHWTPSDVVIPPIQPPEPPMSSLDPAYLFSHMQGEETTFSVPTDLAFGVREGDPGFNNLFYFEAGFQGTISPPPPNWDAIFGDPAPGFVKAVFAKAVGASNGLTEADVNALIDKKLSDLPRKTVLGG